MKIIIYSSHLYEKPFLENASQGNYEVVYTIKTLDSNSVGMAKGCDVVSVFTSDVVSSEIIEMLHNYGVKYLALRSVGYDHVDLIKAQELGLKVANVPEYSPYAVAEHAVTLLMTLNRKIILGQQQMKKNNFSLDKLIGFDLHGKTIGIVGTGKIGAVFAQIMKGFGCKLLGYDLVQNKDLIAQTQIEYTSLEELCKQSDVVSVHCPLNKDTKHLFDKTLFLIMKKGMFFINTARGSIVNTTDLIEAIENKTIVGAGLDVYENEKPIFFRNHLNNVIIDPVFDKLRSFANVIITGHQAYLTNEALTAIAQTTFKNINDWEKHKYCQNDLF